MIHYILLTGLLDGNDAPEPPPSAGGGGGWIGRVASIPKPGEIERIARHVARMLGQDAEKLPRKKARAARKIAEEAEKVAEYIAAPSVDFGALQRELEAQRQFLALLTRWTIETRAQNEMAVLARLLAARLQDEEDAIFVLIA
jgi:hypothetical protein